MPGARCTRGLVCKIAQRKRTRAYRFSGGNPAFPAQWLYGLCRALPGDEFVFVTVAGGLRLIKPGWADFASASLASATGARTTRFCRTQQAPFVLRAVNRSRVETRPAITLRADAAASTASHPAFVTTAIRPSCRERTGRAGRTDLPDGESEIFFSGGLDRFLLRRLICPSGRFVARAYPKSSLRANGSRECAPDDRLREAIHSAACGEMDCFRLRSLSYGGQVVAVAPRNDGLPGGANLPCLVGCFFPLPVLTGRDFYWHL